MEDIGKEGIVVKVNSVSRKWEVSEVRLMCDARAATRQPASGKVNQ